MEQVYYIGLGALLALLGGIITEIINNHLKQKRDERHLLYEVGQYLLEYTPIFVRINSGDLLPSDEENESNIRHDLQRIALRIRSWSYRKLAVELTTFSLQKSFRTTKKLGELTDRVHKALNKPMINKYEKEKRKIKEKIKEAEEVPDKKEEEK